MSRKQVFSCVLAVLAALTIVQVPSAAAAPPSASSPPSTLADLGPECATSATLVSVNPTLGGATAYTERLGDNQFVQVVPPSGWSPVSATDEELHVYGFPPRPTDPEGLADWLDTWSHWKSAAQPGMCELRESASATYGHYSPNWAGGMSINDTTSTNTFFHSTLRWQQPTFTYYCTTGEANYAIWSGLGGWNYNNGQQRLMQTGTGTTPDPLGTQENLIFAWWEMLTTNADNGMMEMGGPIPRGDEIEADTFYDQVSGYALMTVLDMTSGVSYSSGQVYSLSGHPASYYWDGSTSDFISEAPTNMNGVIEQLRRPLAPVYFPYALTNGQAISNFKSWNVEQGTSSHPIDASSFDGVHGWYNTWYNCY